MRPTPLPFWLKVVLCIVGMELLGGLGAFVTTSQIPGWYAGLVSPPGTPPNWLFGPVWTVLYAMMGIAFAIVWNRPIETAGRSCAMRWFGLQLLLNLIWTPVFFGLHQLAAALVIIVMLIAAILFTIRAIGRVSKPAGWLLAPYLIWVTYATYLNAGYAYLNRD